MPAQLVSATCVWEGIAAWSVLYRLGNTLFWGSLSQRPRLVKYYHMIEGGKTTVIVKKLATQESI